MRAELNCCSLVEVMNPSIHLLPLSPGSGRGGNRPAHASLSLATFASSFWGIPRRSKGSWETYGNPSNVSWVFSGVSSQFNTHTDSGPGTFLMGGVQEASELDAQTTSADSFRQGVAAQLQVPS